MATNLVDFAHDLKTKAPIEQVIADYLPSLRQRGRSHLALCPFHEEKTPSFHVTPEFGFYHCFGCNAHGDVIKFVQEFEKIDFRMAVETIARRFNISIPEFRGQRSEEERDKFDRQKARALEICTLAQKYFAHQLWNHPEGTAARAYLTGRDLGEEHIKAYNLGLAPKGYENFLRAASNRGFTPAELVRAGLAIDREGRAPIDRFRDRIIFPIKNHRGETVAFGGRLIEGGGKGGGGGGHEAPKYLNSSDSEVFRKGELLYGLADAREAIRDEESAIIVEGYMDWIALHSRGFRNVVAGLGTAFTREQARLIHRMTKRVTILYDGDEAGQKAMFRAGEHLLAEGIEVSAAALSAEHDPDTFLREHGEEPMGELLAASPPLIDHFLASALDRIPLRGPAERMKVIEFLAPLIRAIKQPELQEAYTNQLRKQLVIDRPEALSAGLRKGRGWQTLSPDASPRSVSGSAPGSGPGSGQTTPDAPESLDSLECYLLNLLMRNVERWEFFEATDVNLIQEDSLRPLFSAIYETAKEVRQGAEVPTDWTSVCKSEHEIRILSHILLFDSIHAGGILRNSETVISDEQIAREFRELTGRLRRNRSRKLRTQEGRKIRAGSVGGDEAREGLARIQAHGSDVIAQTERILEN